MNFSELQSDIRQFVSERDWQQFNTPKNLVMALGGEAGELLDIFQWLTEEQSKNLSSQDLFRTREELADVMIYLLRIFDVLDVDPVQAVKEKMQKNRQKYPLETAKGNPRKYNRRQE